MADKIRILFSIEACDKWIFQAYKGFFKALVALGQHQLFCSLSDGNLPDEQLEEYNVIDYERLSGTAVGLLATRFCSEAGDGRLSDRVRQSVSWSNPGTILERFSLFNVTVNLLRPDIVIVWNGMTDMRLLARQLLQRLGIPFLFAEKGLLPNSWYLDEAGINARCSLDSSCIERMTSAEQETQIEDYIRSIADAGSSAWDQPARVAGGHTLKEKLGIDAGTRVVFFPGQVDNDVNITMFSSFESVAQAVKLVGDSVPGRTTVVVKPHPKAAAASRTQLRQLAQQYACLRIVENVNIWDLIEISDLVASINSTVAFESLLKKKKVLLLGESVLSKVGLLQKADKLHVRMQVHEYLSKPFESIIDYSKVLSFVNFLRDDYYIFRDSAQLPNAVERRLVHEANVPSAKTFTRDVLMSMFYKARPQESFFNTSMQAENAKSPALNSSGLKLSVVLTAHNRPELLEKTLAGFASQTVPKDDFEVIVVDDGSEPPAKEVAEKFRGKINIVYIYQENSGLAAARNNGIKAAKGHIVLFSDDDDVPGPELVAEHLRSHRENPDERIAVLGHLDWHENLQVTPLMHYITHEGRQYFGYDSMEHGQLYNVWKWWGGLISAKMSLLKSVEGPFDSRLRFGYEDTELACRLLNRDIKVLYNARARSHILRPVDFEGFCQRRYMQGQALHHVASVHPDIIVPRYHLQDAASRYYNEYAPFLEEWSSKVIRFENLVRSKPEQQGHQSDDFLKALCTVYRVCFEGYWLKGYVEQMETVGGRKVSLSEPVGRRHTESRDKLELDCNRPSMPSVTEPLRITFLNTNTPGFDISSANLRIYHILKILAAAGHKIDHLYFSRYEDDERYTAAFDGAVNFIKVRGTINSFSDYLRFNRVERLDCVWITNLWSVDYLDFAVQLTRWLKRNHPQSKVIIDTMDFHHKKFMRKFKVSHDEQDLVKAKRFLEIEKKLYPLADVVLTVSEVEKRDILENVGSDCKVNVIPNIHRILAQGPDLRQRKHICYIGSFRISHNVDAVRWFLQEVFALIVQKAPDAEFHILGFANEGVRDELEAIPHVKVMGYVEDAESAVADHRLFVCPMTYGAGMKGKLGLAAAAGTPIVTTTIGAEGFDFVDGQHCFIADAPEEFAEKCLHLLSEASLWSQFSRKAKKLVAEKFSIRAVSEKIHALLKPTTKDRSAEQVTVDSVRAPVSSDHFFPPQAGVRPKVSIITSCYNSARFLRKCLDSIRNQTMHQWELFLLDDGSTDDTRSVIEEYSRVDERIKPYYFQDNEGPYVRRNFAIQRANSDFIVIQDADDIMSPAKLQILYDEITKDQQLGVVGSFFQTCLGEFKGSEYADSIELPTTHDRIMEQYASTLYICWHGSAIIRRSLFEAIGLYDENPFGSDTLWLAKAAEYARYSNEIRFKNIPVYLTVKREHASSQQGRLPIVDPRSRRARFRIFWLHKLLKIREKLQKNPAVDIKTELSNCKCNDYMNRYSNFFEQWESEPLGNNVIGQLVNTAVVLFNDHRYVSCITTLNGMEVSLGDMTKRFKNYDLLRALAFFAIDMKEQSLMHAKREMQNHSNPAAKQFISDYFEGPRSTRRSQSGNVKQQLQTDVQRWCAEHSDLYELQMIDTRIVPAV